MLGMLSSEAHTQGLPCSSHAGRWAPPRAPTILQGQVDGEAAQNAGLNLLAPSRIRAHCSDGGTQAAALIALASTACRVAGRRVHASMAAQRLPGSPPVARLK
jgi:hypothetical protein